MSPQSPNPPSADPLANSTGVVWLLNDWQTNPKLICLFSQHSSPKQKLSCGNYGPHQRSPLNTVWSYIENRGPLTPTRVSTRLFNICWKLYVIRWSNICIDVYFIHGRVEAFKKAFVITNYNKTLCIMYHKTLKLYGNRSLFLLWGSQNTVIHFICWIVQIWTSVKLWCSRRSYFK